MANALYDLGRQKFLEGVVAWLTDDIRALLVRESGGGGGPYYTPNLVTDDFLDDIPNNTDCRVGAAVALGTKTSTLGVADAADVTFSTVASGDAIQTVVLYDHTGTDGTSALVANIDTATGLPVTPNGGDITIAWDSGANKIFKL